MGGWSPRTRSVGLSPGDPDDEPEGLERKQLLGRDADQKPAGRRGLVVFQHIPHETVGAYVAAAVMHAAFHLDRQPASRDGEVERPVAGRMEAVFRLHPKAGVLAHQPLKD